MDALLVAHEGGWDEAAMVLVPLLFLALLLRVAHVRASRLDDVGPDDRSTPEPSDASDS
jgi:hypothetical protein